MEPPLHVHRFSPERVERAIARTLWERAWMLEEQAEQSRRPDTGDFIGLRYHPARRDPSIPELSPAEIQRKRRRDRAIAESNGHGEGIAYEHDTGLILLPPEDRQALKKKREKAWELGTVETEGLSPEVIKLIKEQASDREAEKHAIWGDSHEARMPLEDDHQDGEVYARDPLEALEALRMRARVEIALEGGRRRGPESIGAILDTLNATGAGDVGMHSTLDPEQSHFGVIHLARWNKDGERGLWDEAKGPAQLTSLLLRRLVRMWGIRISLRPAPLPRTRLAGNRVAGRKRGRQHGPRRADYPKGKDGLRRYRAERSAFLMRRAAL